MPMNLASAAQPLFVSSAGLVRVAVAGLVWYFAGI